MASTFPPSPHPRKIGGIALWITAGLVLLAIIAYFAIGAVAANALTQPRRDFSAGITPDTVNLPFEAVRFPARDGAAEIAGWFIPAGESAPVIIMVHGRDASRTAAVKGAFLQEAKLLHDAGFAVLMIDLRGHGESSDARFTFGLKERADVLGAVDWLLQRGVAAGRIGVLGLSLGAAAGIGAAAEDPAIGALVTDSAFADINPLIEQQWEAASGLPKPFLYAALLMARVLTGEDLTQARPVQELAQVAPRPVLLIHCAADDYVPAENLSALHAVDPDAESWLIPGTGCLHSEGFNVDPAVYGARVAAFFAEAFSLTSSEQE
jgi:dipeptidyl aminopeptidase/acylaminoacyl peptidase